jgi:hypothetical protein
MKMIILLSATYTTDYAQDPVKAKMKGLTSHGYFNKATCSCVSITLPASSYTRLTASGVANGTNKHYFGCYIVVAGVLS